jgi:hypothetical protein
MTTRETFRDTPATRSFLAAGVVVLGLLMGLTEARADAIGTFDPMASEICGGSYHHPNCSGVSLASGACAVMSVALVGIGFAVRARRKGRDER